MKAKDITIIDYQKMLEKEKEISFKAGIREVVEFAQKFLDLAFHGDYSNGVEAYGLDEGRVRAGELLDSYEKEWQAQLKDWGIKND